MAKDKADDKTVESIFEYFGEKTDEEKKAGEKTSEPEGVEALTTQLTEQSKRIDELVETNQILQAGMFQARNPAGVVAPVVDTPPVLDQTGLPDAQDQPEEYQKAFAGRIGKFVSDTTAHATRAAQAEVTAQAAASAQRTGLWDNFTAQFPELASKKAHVETAARIVLERAAGKGLDQNTYMYNMTGQFFKEVAAEANLMIPPEKKADGDGDGKGEGEGNNPAKPTAEETAAALAAQRTGGIVGGDQSPQANKAADTEDQPGSLIKDIMDIQKKSGFF